MQRTTYRGSDLRWHLEWDTATLWENPKSMAVRKRETDRERLREIEDGF